MVLLECKTEKWNSQCEYGQPMEQTRGLFCMCDSGMARCKSQHQCHFWPMNLMFILHGQVSWAAVNQIYAFHEAISKYSLMACFENVNIMN